MTDTPSTLTYTNVVLRESVQIALTIAALNDLKVKAGNIMNAYLTAPVTEKIWITVPSLDLMKGRRPSLYDHFMALNNQEPHSAITWLVICRPWATCHAWQTKTYGTSQ